eukprot:2329246-Lingulodinium_polyedra.AAC.1
MPTLCGGEQTILLMVQLRVGEQWCCLGDGRDRAGTNAQRPNTTDTHGLREIMGQRGRLRRTILRCLARNRHEE